MARRLDWNAVVALREAEAAGIPVLMATGNVIPVSKTIGHCIGTTGPHVCENGGVLYWELPDPDTGGLKILRKVLHDRKDPDRVVKELERNGYDPRPISSDPWRESETALELATTRKEDVERVVTAMGLDHLYVVTTGFACHILHRGINKFEGTQKAVDWINEHDPRFNPDHPQGHENATPLSVEEVLGIGDSPNDHELLLYCGVGAAVADAPDALKQVADIVADRSHGSGVREVLSRLGLEIPQQ